MVSDRSNQGPRRVLETWSAHRQRHRYASIGPLGRLEDLLRTGHPAEIDNLSPFTPNQIGEERCGQGVGVPRGACDDDCSCSPPSPGGRTQPRNQAHCNHGGDVFLGDRAFSVGPALTGLSHCGRNELLLSPQRFGVNSRNLQQFPCSGFITDLHQFPQRFDRGEGCIRVGLAVVGLPLKRIQVGLFHHPPAAILVRRKVTNPYVSVGGHVVDAKKISYFVQGQIGSGCSTHETEE